jgi:hypothetical protein
MLGLQGKKEEAPTKLAVNTWVVCVMLGDIREKLAYFTKRSDADTTADAVDGGFVRPKWVM